MYSACNIPHIEYLGIDDIYNTIVHPKFEMRKSFKYSEKFFIMPEDYYTDNDKRYLTSGIESIYEDEYSEYLRDFYSYMEYNEVYDY